MRFIQRFAPSLIAVFLLPWGCGRSTKPPASLHYTTATAIYTKLAQITPNSPASSGGAVNSYSISPTLPAGLSMNATSGVIGGPPTAVAAAASYTVVASNGAGSTVATLAITVNDQPPSGLSYTPGSAV